MIHPRRNSGVRPESFRLFYPVVLILLGLGFFSPLQAETPYNVELRVSDEPSLQLLDNKGKLYETLPTGTVRKKVEVQDTLLLASFGEDNQHHPIIMLGLDISTNYPVTFLFGKNIIVASPESMLTFQLSPDRSVAFISPSLMGKIWINGSILPRGETKKLILRTGKTPGSGSDTPSPVQPKPTTKDFESIQPPSI